MNSTTVAVDVAKSIFQVAVSDQPGRVRQRHRFPDRASCDGWARLPPRSFS
jgi:hypothetical protein